MHILLIADGRSPIARRWIQGMLALEHRVSLVSSYPCSAVPGVAAQYVLPVAFAGLGGSQAGGAAGAAPSGRQLVSRARKAFLAARYWLGPLTLPSYGRKLRKILAETTPDLIHALRI